MYLTQSKIANDASMRSRVAQAAAEQGSSDVGIRPDTWAAEWSRNWAAAPGWDEAWESAEAGGVESPGSDPAVITDAQILSQVQAMMPFRYIGQPLPPGPGGASK